MDINELESFKLSDAVKFHNNLNPALWTKDAELLPEVRKQLMVIAKDFLSFLGIPSFKVEDVTVSGSNAAYTYTPHSDLDLHILVDFSKLPNDEVYQELFTAKKTLYNDNHDITVHGVPVELYIQDSNQPVVSLGEYSILNNDWIKIPKRRKANFNQNATKAKYEKLGSLLELALQTRSLPQVTKVLDIVKRYRKAGLDKTGEFGPENLAYKALRSKGYIKQLYDLKNELHSEKLSIEEDDLFEGGWTTGDNPGIKAKVVKQGIASVEKFIKDFNPYLKKQGLGPIKVGSPTGSAAYHELDDPEKTIYGDMDIQLIIPDMPAYENMTSGQIQGFWGKLISKFIQDSNLPYIDKTESIDVHPMFKFKDGSKIQVDLMLHPKKTAEWGRFRATGEHGLKGVLNGNIFATMSDMIPINLQHRGSQYKTIDGKKVSYSRTLKNYKLHTIGTDIKRWILDLFLHEAKDIGIKNPKIDPLLKNNPGVDIENVNIERQINGIKGFARSCELNNMFGKGDLEKFSSANDFLDQFLKSYITKVRYGITAKKRDKASTPASIARAEKDREALRKGLDYVQKLFTGETTGRFKDYKTEDYDPNGPPPGPEFKPTMPQGTVRVDVSDVYDWYKLGQHISNLKGLGKHDFGKGPPSTILSFGDEDLEHQYIQALNKTGLDTTDIDPKAHDTKKGQKVDPTFNVNELLDPKSASEIEWEHEDNGVNIFVSTAIAKDKNKNRLKYDFIYFLRFDLTSIEFKRAVAPRGSNYEINKAGDQYTVFATLIEAIKQYLSENKPKFILFTAKEPSRVKLYKTFVNRFASKFGYKQISPDNIPDRVRSILLSSGDTPFLLQTVESEPVQESVKFIEGTNCKNCVWWKKDSEKPVGKDELNKYGGLKPPNKEYIAMSKRVDLVTLPGKDSVKEKAFCYHKDINDWVTERMCCAKWDGKGVIRDYKGESPLMLENLDEASGYIPSEKEKNDPRFKTALTVDVKPDSIQRNAKAFGFKVARNGRPPLLRK